MQAAEEANVDPDEISAEKLMIIMSNVGMHATAEQVQSFALGQHCRRSSFDGEGLWVAQIGRYRMEKGEWTKHYQFLQAPSIFNLPVTKDGNKEMHISMDTILRCMSTEAFAG